MLDRLFLSKTFIFLSILFTPSRFGRVSLINKALASSIDSISIPIEQACLYIEDTFNQNDLGFSEDIRNFLSEGKYQNEKLLGVGAFGFVFKTDFQKEKAAVKIIPKIKSNIYSIGEELYRWLTFSKNFPLDALDFLGCFHDMNHVYFLSNLMSGSLRQFSKERLIGKIDSISSEIYELMKRLAEITHHVHQFGIVHHDIKPENFLYKELSDDKFPNKELFDIRIIDFGFARSVEEKRWFCGTALFMPPEKFLFKDVGPLSDIYSLGITFWDLLSGDVKIKRDCYNPRGFNPDSYVDIVFKMQDFFQEKFNFSLLDDFHLFKDSQNLPDMIFNMMTFDYKDRPSAIMVMEKLDQFSRQVKNDKLNI